MLPTIAVVVTLFSGCLLGTDRLAFRDVSHFYTPLYGYLADRAAEETLPLWNPGCQTGMPILGETSTALLYPGRLLLGYLPLSAPTQIAWYMALHLIGAGFAAAIAATRVGVGPLGQTIAAITYPLSGGVFFLHTNPPFLVGAAWMPLVISYLLVPAASSLRRRVQIAAGSSAMIVLGGDPQTPLHCFLIALPLILLSNFRNRHDLRRESLLAFASAAVAILLSAPQIAGSLSWSWQSARHRQSAREASPFQPPLVNGPKHQAMQYSIPPWQFAECLSPAAFGKRVPQNRRWSGMIGGDGRRWTPTLFLGLLPMLMIADRLLAVGRETPSPQRLWLFLACSGVLLSMGSFGGAWWIHWLTGWLPRTDGASMGPYWFLYHFFPGYNAFRYPAKWLPFVSLGLTIATVIWIDSHRWLQADRANNSVGVLILIGGLVSWVGLPWLSVPTPSDNRWGPLDQNAAIWLSRISWLSSFGMLAVWRVVAWRGRRFQDSPKRTWIDYVIVFALAIELGSVAWGHTYTVSVAKEAQLIGHLRATTVGLGTGSHRAIRYNAANRDRQRGIWPRPWQTSPSDHRLLEVAASERASGFGRWHLEQGLPTLNNFVSIQSAHQAWFWQAIHQVEADRGLETADWSRLESWLGIDVNVLQNGKHQTVDLGDQRYELASTPMVRSSSGTPTAHGSSNLVTPRTIENVSPEQVKHRLLEILSQPMAAPVLGGVRESLPPQVEVLDIPADDQTGGISVDKPTLVTRPVFQDGHWLAKVRHSRMEKDEAGGWKIQQVFQADFIKQAIVLPPGRWDIQFVYRPWWLWPSMVISAVAWCLMWVRLKHFDHAQQIIRQGSFMGHRFSGLRVDER